MDLGSRFLLLEDSEGKLFLNLLYFLPYFGLSQHLWVIFRERPVINTHVYQLEVIVYKHVGQLEFIINTQIGNMKFSLLPTLAN